MKALFVMCSLDYVDEFLMSEDIDHIAWTNEVYGESEIRVDLASIEPFEVDILKEKFSIKEPIDEYEYLIFWK